MKNLIKILLPVIITATFFSCTESDQDLSDKGYNYSRQKKYDQAIKVFTKLINRQPSYQNPYYNRGICYLQLENYTKAMADFNKVIALQGPRDGLVFTMNPNAPFASEKDKNQVPYEEVIYQRAQTEFFMDSLKSSFTDFNYLVNINFSEKSNCYLWEGSIYNKAGKQEKACEYFELAKTSASNENDILEAERMISESCKLKAK